MIVKPHAETNVCSTSCEIRGNNNKPRYLFIPFTNTVFNKVGKTTSLLEIHLNRKAKAKTRLIVIFTILM